MIVFYILLVFKVDSGVATRVDHEFNTEKECKDNIRHHVQSIPRSLYGYCQKVYK